MKTYTSRALAGDDLIVLPLADASEGIVFSQRVGAKAVPGHQPAQVGVAGENDAHQVVLFALHPFGAGPDARDRIDFQSRIAFFQNLLVARRGPGSVSTVGSKKSFSHRRLLLGMETSP